MFISVALSASYSNPNYSTYVYVHSTCENQQIQGYLKNNVKQKKDVPCFFFHVMSAKRAYELMRRESEVKASM